VKLPIFEDVFIAAYSGMVISINFGYQPPAKMWVRRPQNVTIKHIKSLKQSWWQNCQRKYGTLVETLSSLELEGFPLPDFVYQV
jgi:hypothetical protein